MLTVKYIISLNAKSREFNIYVEAYKRLGDKKLLQLINRKNQVSSHQSFYFGCFSEIIHQIMYLNVRRRLHIIPPTS